MKRITECYIQISPNEIFDKSDVNPYNNIVPFPLEAIFNWRANALIDYIWRRLKEEGHFTENFSKISIHLCKKPKPDYKIFDGVIIYEIFFEEKIYRKFIQSDMQDIQEFIIKNLSKGIENLYKSRKDIPKDTLFKILEEFRINNYENNWILKTKKLTINNKKYQCILECKENMDNFVLNYYVYDQLNEILFEKELLKTIPSPSFYNSELKNIKFKTNKLILNTLNLDSFDFESLLVV